jgi:hypothetical protein
VEPRLKPTNVKKIFWPAEGYTKGDLIEYYERVAPVMLPYLRDRPLVLTRFPDGITGKSFYQKDAPDFAPAWMRTERIYSRDTERDIAYLVVDDVEMLRYVANSGAIPIHLWASRIPSLERPDWLVLDLDPKGAPFTDVVRVALALRRILDRLELPSYVKTSGATVHPVPWAPGRTRKQFSAAPSPPGVAKCDRHLPLRASARFRLRPERARPDHRRALFAAAVARRSRFLPARMARGDLASRSGALHTQDPARALRQDGGSADAGARRRHRHGRRAGAHLGQTWRSSRSWRANAGPVPASSCLK